jgi:hypothetical protein
VWYVFQLFSLSYCDFLLYIIVHCCVLLCWNASVSREPLSVRRMCRLARYFVLVFNRTTTTKPRLARYTVCIFKLHHRHHFEERWSYHICMYYHNAIYYVINGKTSLIPTTPVPLLEATFGWLARVLYRDCYVLLNIVFLCWVASVSSEPFRTNAPARQLHFSLF